MQQLPMDRSLHRLIVYYNCGCSGIVRWLTFNPVDGFHIIGSMMYVPLGVLAATVTIPLASMLNGPVVNGVTLVLVVVAAMLLNVSFVNAFNAYYRIV
jgi:hypothetical protein